MPAGALLDSLIRSLQVGSLYALMAVGLTLTLAVVRLPNFAHAELITIGAYTALLVSLHATQNLFWMVLAAGVAAAATALLAHRAVFRPLEGIGSSRFTLILSSFALGLLLRSLVFLPADRYRLLDARIPLTLRAVYEGDGWTVTNVVLITAPAALALALGLTVLLRRTELGRRMRAVADDPVLAQVTGVPTRRVQDLTWVLAGALAGAGGALWGLSTSVHPSMGWAAILPVFAATILGGTGRFGGTILGAFAVGLCENTVMQLLHDLTGLDFSFKPAIPFLLILVVLFARPEGLGGLLRAGGRSSGAAA